MRCQGSATHLLKKATHFLRNCVTISVKPATKLVVVLFYYLFKCLKDWANGRQVRIRKSSEPRPRGEEDKNHVPSGLGSFVVCFLVTKECYVYCPSSLNVTWRNQKAKTKQRKTRRRLCVYWIISKSCQMWFLLDFLGQTSGFRHLVLLHKQKHERQHFGIPRNIALHDHRPVIINCSFIQNCCNSLIELIMFFTRVCLSRKVWCRIFFLIWSHVQVSLLRHVILKNTRVIGWYVLLMPCLKILLLFRLLQLNWSNSAVNPKLTTVI